MTDEVTLNRETVELLLQGARHLYYPAFPNEKNRREIGMAVNAAEGQLEEFK